MIAGRLMSADVRPAAVQPIEQRRRDALRKHALPLPAVLYILSVVTPVSVNLGPLSITMLRMILMIMLIPLVLYVSNRKHGPIFAVDILFILHVIWMCAALAINNPSQAVQQAGSVGIEFIGGYLMGRVYIRTPEDFYALCRWLVLIVLCSVPFALFEAKTGRPLILEVVRALHVASVGIVAIDGRLGLERVQLVFAHPIHYGLFCSVILSLSFVAMRDIRSGPSRYVTSVIAGFCGFLALSSGAILAIILQVSLIFWARVFQGTRFRWWLLLGLFVLIYILIDITSNRTPMRVFMSYATFSAHTAYWRSIIFEWGMKNVWANPWFGLGLNDWVRPSYMVSGSMDNFWLVMAVRYGVFGFLFLTVGYALAVFRIMARDFEQDPVLARMRRAWVFTFLGLSFTLSTVHIWSNIYSFVFFMFGAGIWLLSAQPKATATAKATAEPDVSGLRYSRFAPGSVRHIRPDNANTGGS